MASLVSYVMGLLVVSSLLLWAGNAKKSVRGQVWRVVLVIMLNWCCGVTYITATGDQAPWEFNILIDTLSAFAILSNPVSRPQAYIGICYLAQICAHTAYGIREFFKFPNDVVFYYDALTLVAWTQLAVMGMWACGIGGSIVLHRLRGGRNARSLRAASLHIGRGGQ